MRFDHHALYNSTVHYIQVLDHRRLIKPDVVDCNGESTGDTDTSRHNGSLDSTMQVRTPDVSVAPMEISS